MGAFSTVIASTAAVNAPTAPTAVAAAAIAGTNGLAVTWSAPTTPGTLTGVGYIVEYRIEDDSITTPITVPGIASGTLTIPDLMLSTAYEVRVAAIYEVEVEVDPYPYVPTFPPLTPSTRSPPVIVTHVTYERIGPYSALVSATTATVAIPAAPTSVVVMPVGGTTNSLTVSWAPAPAAPVVSGYVVLYRRTGVGAFTSTGVTVNDDLDGATIVGLSPGTAYSVGVAATNVAGTSEYATGDGATTSADSIVLTADPDGVIEDGGERTVTVTATIMPTGATFTSDQTVTLSVAGGGGAVAVTDFETVSSIVAITIPMGMSSGETTFMLTPVPDDMVDSGESVEVSGVHGPTPALDVVAANVLIIDSDGVPGAPAIDSVRPSPARQTAV